MGRSWAAELRDAFRRLESREAPQVTFAERSDMVGEIGREFNALAEEWAQQNPDGLDREVAHRLRNRLAGILAALHVLEATGKLSPEERTTLKQVSATAKQFDNRWRAR